MSVFKPKLQDWDFKFCKMHLGLCMSRGTISSVGFMVEQSPGGGS